MTLKYPDDTRVWGADISFYQDDNSTPRGFDFARLKEQGADFVFIRAGQGSWYDPDFVMNWQAAKEAGIPRGAYWFLDARNSGDAQARLFRSLLGNDWGEISPVVDYEHKAIVASRGKGGAVSSKFVYNTPEQLDQFIDVLGSASPPIIYTGYYYWFDHGSTNNRYAQYPLWLAAYDTDEPKIPNPWRYWTFHQWTDKGNGVVMGSESKELDLNYFFGTKPDFDNFLKRDVDTVPTPPDQRNKILDEAADAVLKLKK